MKTPINISFSKKLDASAADVWKLITDTATWPIWGPTVRAVDTPERFISAGSTGRIQTPVGLWMPFIIGTFQPPHFWDWRVGGVPATGHRVDPIRPNQSRLSFTVPIWAPGYGFVCRIALNRISRLLNRVSTPNGS